MGMYLKFKDENEAVLIPFKEMCKDMHKKAKQLRLACFFIKSFVIHTIITLLFDGSQLLTMHNIDIFVINSSTYVCMFSYQFAYLYVWCVSGSLNPIFPGRL